MGMRLAASLLLCGLSSLATIGAEGVDPNLMREVAAVREQMVRSNAALRDYTWVEHMDVLVSGSVKSSSVFVCAYNGSGELTRAPVDKPDGNQGNAVSKRPRVRAKADLEDYIRRSISQVRAYLPPKPEDIQYVLQSGLASQGQSQSGSAELRLTHYFQEGDSFVFTYDPVSKVLLRASIASNLGSPKDPVALEAVFETLPDGVNHLGSATLNAKKRNVQVKLWNEMYQKLAN